ncbi:hypothetical protein CXG81DRAFT_20959 [Caulochytrium protostelioides]|uniref:Uncharacterized protein n=1 Tax=Caulochytrium protostelioides TaxID=1555241 RepID=A0A4P9X1Q3_9FUNG|nr:hypothetical protein CXG81DRAFT_20959 [Caulochytrium protostelioides]|eukprot:RKO98893.1 hypothetical protein CXG81DRAFT_20959 [Caulochytrium protostelioides]
MTPTEAAQRLARGFPDHLSRLLAGDAAGPLTVAVGTCPSALVLCHLLQTTMPHVAIEAVSVHPQLDAVLPAVAVTAARARRDAVQAWLGAAGIRATTLDIDWRRPLTSYRPQNRKWPAGYTDDQLRDFYDRDIKTLVRHFRFHRDALLVRHAYAHQAAALVTGHHASDHLAKVVQQFFRNPMFHSVTGLTPLEHTTSSPILLSRFVPTLRPLLGCHWQTLRAYARDAGLEAAVPGLFDHVNRARHPFSYDEERRLEAVDATNVAKRGVMPPVSVLEDQLLATEAAGAAVDRISPGAAPPPTASPPTALTPTALTPTVPQSTAPTPSASGLPLAYPDLYHFARRLSATQSLMDQTVTEILQTAVSGDAAVGAVSLYIGDAAPATFHTHWLNDPVIAEAVMRRVLIWTVGIAPKPREMATLLAGMRLYYRARWAQRSVIAPYTYLAAGKAIISPPTNHPRIPPMTWTITKGCWQTPPRRSDPAAYVRPSATVVPLEIGQSALWDERFVVSLLPPGGDDSAPAAVDEHTARRGYVVRPLWAHDLEHTAQRLRTVRHRGSPSARDARRLLDTLRASVAALPLPSRAGTLPCVVRADEPDIVIAVPSLGLNWVPQELRIRFAYVQPSWATVATLDPRFEVVAEAEPSASS